MKNLMLTLLILSAFSAHASNLVFTPALKSQILKAALMKTQADRKLYYSDLANDLRNILSIPDLEVENSVQFGTIATLKQLDCENVSSGFECKAAIQYCVERNEYAPSLDSVTIKGTADLKIKKLSIQKTELSDVVCN